MNSYGPGYPGRQDYVVLAMDETPDATAAGHREVRPVPLGWEHPREPGERGSENPRYRPLRPLADLLDRMEEGAEPDLSSYMPLLPPGGDVGYALYESDGTPLSPVFRTLSALATWCSDKGFPLAGDPGAERSFRAQALWESAPSHRWIFLPQLASMDALVARERLRQEGGRARGLDLVEQQHEMGRHRRLRRP
jgi:hypothetical protein